LSVLLSARLENRQRELFDDPHDQQRQLGLLIDRLSSRLRRESVVRAVLVPDAQPEYAYRYEPLAGSRPQRGATARRKRTSHAPTQASGLKPQTSAHTGKMPVAHSQPSARTGKMPVAHEEVQSEFNTKNTGETPVAHISAHTPVSGLKPQASSLTPPASAPERPLWLEARPAPLAVAVVQPDGPPLQFRLHGQPHRVARAWGPERIQTGWWRGRYLRRDYYRVETTCGERFWIFRSGQNWFLQGWFD
jgi:hypothetical protein